MYGWFMRLGSHIGAFSGSPECPQTACFLDIKGMSGCNETILPLGADLRFPHTLLRSETASFQYFGRAGHYL